MTLVADTEPTGFVRHRPRYPSGTPVPGFGAVKTVLFADGGCEVYLLDFAGSGTTLLLSVATPRAPTPDQLAAWLDGHGAERLSGPTPAAGHLDTVVRVHGTWMATIPAEPLLEDELYALLMALIDLAADAAHAGLAAVPIRPLLWVDGPRGRPRLASVFLRAGGEETEVVRAIGQTFLVAATGVSIETAPWPEAVRLDDWCQNADAALSRTIARCLGTGAPIPTLHALRQEVLANLAALGDRLPATEQAADAFIALSPHRLLWRRRIGRDTA